MRVIVAVVADSEDIVTADLEMMDSMRSMVITCTFLKGKRFESYCMESIIKQLVSSGKPKPIADSEV